MRKTLIVPLILGTLVVVLPATLITVGVRGPYTHANLGPGFDPDYTRTEQALVGASAPHSGAGHVGSLVETTDPAERGKVLFVVAGCASCHGLDGSGGVVGPAIEVFDPQTLQTYARSGPGGMPPHSPEALTDEDLAYITAYIWTVWARARSRP